MAGAGRPEWQAQPLRRVCDALSLPGCARFGARGPAVLQPGLTTHSGGRTTPSGLSSAPVELSLAVRAGQRREHRCPDLSPFNEGGKARPFALVLRRQLPHFFPSSSCGST